MAVPNLSALSHRIADVSVQLRGIDRPSGRPGPGEDTTDSRPVYTAGRMHTPGGQYASAGKARLEAIAAKVDAGSRDPLAVRWIAAVVQSMEHKERLYQESGRELDAAIGDQQQKLNEFVRNARLSVGRAEEPDPGMTHARGPTAPAEDDALAQWHQTDKWDLIQDRSDHWSSLVAQKAAFHAIGMTARARKDAARFVTSGNSLRRAFSESVLELASYEAQPLLLDSMADLIEAFVNSPLVTHNAFVNFVIAGDPGVGKTRLAHSLGKMLSRLGLYVYESVVECGRSDFVAQFVGQTAPKTKAFLLSNLEKIIFLDEAYALTSWSERSNATTGRTLDSYSDEAMTEVVAFLSQYVGRSCIIAAGYEQQMMLDFLPANDGLARRFEYIVIIHAYSAEFMVRILVDALAKALSTETDVKTPSGVRDYFTLPAIKFLEDVLIESKRSISGRPAFPLLHQLFAPQAGAMVNLANVAAVLISSNSRGPSLVGVGGMGQRAAWAIGFLDMHDLLVTQLQRRFPERLGSVEGATGWTAASRELAMVGAENGWIRDGRWVTSRAATELVAVFDAEVASGRSSSDASELSDATTARPRRRATRTHSSN